MELVFHGHSCFSIKTSRYHILIDPYIDENPLAKIKAEELAPDFLLLTHGHDDHLGDTLAIAKAANPLIIAPTELAGWCESKGLRTHAMYMGSAAFPFGKLTMVFASHGSSIQEDGERLYGGLACGYVLELEGKRIYHAGDTGIFGDMKLLSGRRSVDVALLPIGGNFTMDPEEALEAAKLIRAGLTIPMHYNTFPLIRQDGAKFVDSLKTIGLKALMLEPGEVLEL